MLNRQLHDLTGLDVRTSTGDTETPATGSASLVREDTNQRVQVTPLYLPAVFVFVAGPQDISFETVQSRGDSVKHQDEVNPVKLCCREPIRTQQRYHEPSRNREYRPAMQR